MTDSNVRMRALQMWTADALRKEEAAAQFAARINAAMHGQHESVHAQARAAALRGPIAEQPIAEQPVEEQPVEEQPELEITHNRRVVRVRCR